jgi:mannosyltransferase OCH1-like enzyme
MKGDNASSLTPSERKKEMMMQRVLYYRHYGALFVLTTLSFQLLSREFSDIKKYNVDFDTSMEFSKNDAFASQRLEKKKSQVTEFCKKLYNRNNLSRVEPLDHVIIPRIVHIIWVGPKTPPPVFKRCLESIKKHLPDWELKLWTDADLPHLKLENQYY